MLRVSKASQVCSFLYKRQEVEVDKGVFMRGRENLFD